MSDSALAAGSSRHRPSGPVRTRSSRVSVTPTIRAKPAPGWLANLKWALVALDFFAISVALVITYLLAFGAQANAPVSGSHDTIPHWAVSVVLGIGWMVLLAASDSRRARFLGAGMEEYRRIISASLQLFGAIAIASYLLRLDVSRFLFLSTLPVGLAFLLLGRFLARTLLASARARGRASVPTLVIGDEREVALTLNQLKRNPAAGYRPVGVSLVRRVGEEDTADEFHGLPVVSQPWIISRVGELSRSAVVIAGGLSSTETRRLAWALESSTTQLLIVPRMLDVVGPRMSIQQAAGVNLVHVELPTYSGARYLIKRSFDVAFSLVALLLLAPLFGLIAMAIKIEDGGPVLFRQKRVGLQGEEFILHKFRSMHVDAEARLEELKEHSMGDGPLFKMDDDPRCTRVGRFIRKFSLDELPQFWTTLKGHMSVVGPRPHLAHELEAFPKDALRRLLIKPGITGLWQISGRSDLSIDDAIRLDLRYVENWTLVGDISIILRTVQAMLRPRGAY